MNQEQYIEHEVKLRVMKEKNSEQYVAFKEAVKDLRDDMRHIDTKMDSQFKWTLGIMLSIFGALILTKVL